MVLKKWLKNIQTTGYNGSHTVGLHFANILEQVLSKLSASWLLGTQSYCTTIFANQIRSGDTPPRNHRIKTFKIVSSR